jgi:hypothetical protein
VQAHRIPEAGGGNLCRDLIEQLAVTDQIELHTARCRERGEGIDEVADALPVDEAAAEDEADGAVFRLVGIGPFLPAGEIYAAFRDDVDRAAHARRQGGARTFVADDQRGGVAFRRGDAVEQARTCARDADRRVDQPPLHERERRGQVHAAAHRADHHRRVQSVEEAQGLGRDRGGLEHDLDRMRRDQPHDLRAHPPLGQRVDQLVEDQILDAVRHPSADREQQALQRAVLDEGDAGERRGSEIGAQVFADAGVADRVDGAAGKGQVAQIIPGDQRLAAQPLGHVLGDQQHAQRRGVIRSVLRS